MALRGSLELVHQKLWELSEQARGKDLSDPPTFPQDLVEALVILQPKLHPTLRFCLCFSYSRSNNAWRLHSVLHPELTEGDKAGFAVVLHLVSSAALGQSAWEMLPFRFVTGNMWCKVMEYLAYSVCAASKGLLSHMGPNSQLV